MNLIPLSWQVLCKPFTRERKPHKNVKSYKPCGGTPSCHCTTSTSSSRPVFSLSSFCNKNDPMNELISTIFSTVLITFLCEVSWPQEKTVA